MGKWKKTLRYYGNKLICFGLACIGVDIYSRFLWNQSYLTDEDIQKQTSDNLRRQIKISIKKREWHRKSFTLTILCFPIIYGLEQYNCITYDQATCGYTSTGILTLNSIYGILANYYNQIRFQTYLEHLNKLQEQDGTISLNATLFDLINTEKQSWQLFSYVVDEEIVHAVMNNYYENLVFIFHCDIMAKEFFDEISNSNIPLKHIIFLANHPEEALRIQREFIRAKKLIA